MNPFTLMFVLLAFIINSAISRQFFSSVLKDFTRTEALRKDAMLVSLSGTIIGAASSLFIAFIPTYITYLDVSIGLVFVTWSVLLRYHLGLSLGEALIFSFVATIVYALVFVLTSGFFILILRAGI